MVSGPLFHFIHADTHTYSSPLSNIEILHPSGVPGMSLKDGMDTPRAGQSQRTATMVQCLTGRQDEDLPE